MILVSQCYIPMVLQQDWLPSPILSLTYHPTTFTLATSRADGAVQTYDAHAPNLGLIELAQFDAHESAVTCIALSGNEELLATGGMDNQVKVGTVCSWQGKVWQQHSRRACGCCCLVVAPPSHNGHGSGNLASRGAATRCWPQNGHYVGRLLARLHACCKCKHRQESCPLGGGERHGGAVSHGAYRACVLHLFRQIRRQSLHSIVRQNIEGIARSTYSVLSGRDSQHGVLLSFGMSEATTPKMWAPKSSTRRARKSFQKGVWTRLEARKVARRADRSEVRPG